jgi:Rrf2 family protein
MLSHKAKYALRALIVFAQQPDDRLLQVADIAAIESIPRKFLEAILGELAKNGALSSQRGKGGGYRLARPADTITVGQVVRLIDGPLALVPCASVSQYRRCYDCKDERTCAIRLVMRQVRDAMADVLDRTTIADLAGSPSKALLVA